MTLYEFQVWDSHGCYKLATKWMELPQLLDELEINRVNHLVIDIEPDVPRLRVLEIRNNLVATLGELERRFFYREESFHPQHPFGTYMPSDRFPGCMSFGHSPPILSGFVT